MINVWLKVLRLIVFNGPPVWSRSTFAPELFFGASDRFARQIVGEIVMWIANVYLSTTPSQTTNPGSLKEKILPSINFAAPNHRGRAKLFISLSKNDWKSDFLWQLELGESATLYVKLVNGVDSVIVLRAGPSAPPGPCWSSQQCLGGAVRISRMTRRAIRAKIEAHELRSLLAACIKVYDSSDAASTRAAHGPSGSKAPVAIS
ncbi:hypothetical protein C8F04DRAFT_1177256 [Mycena alexandri]|uniref:Uncharacterized protein n=1 Tax=Mycena alexandri TaxID=1745969 RepID=A0AAD6TBK3_9AGAR|nr:hypothetical protein C8F04DRAFT_1177256 [Mycena alexandri]